MSQDLRDSDIYHDVNGKTWLRDAKDERGRPIPPSQSVIGKPNIFKILPSTILLQAKHLVKSSNLYLFV